MHDPDFDFQKEVIRKLAIIETKLDGSLARVGSLETDVAEIKQEQAEGRGAGRIITGAVGIMGGIAGSLVGYIFRK